MNRQDPLQQVSASSIAQLLDCSLSQLYKDVDGGNFPEPDVKLWKESKRGYRWYRTTLERYVQEREIRRFGNLDDEEDAKPFVPVKLEDILRRNKVRVA